MIIDTHCHYNLPLLFDHWQQHWQTAQDRGVLKSIVVGADLATSQRAVEIANQTPNLLAAVGVHPDEVGQPVPELKQLSTHPKVIAVGEVGLDYYRLSATNKTAVINRQQDLFKQQIELANQLKLPLIVHVRDQETPETVTINNAYWDTLQLIKAHYQFDRPFILHCVSGPLNYIKQALEMGAYIGVAANVTYKNAHLIREIVKITPPDRLLVETDAPFLPPQTYRGQICEPWMIVETDQYLKENFNQTQMFNNTLKLFPQLLEDG